MQDGRAIANDFVTNLVALGIYNHWIAQHVVSQNDSALLSTAKAALVVTGLEEGKRVLRNEGVNLNIFRQKMPSLLSDKFLRYCQQSASTQHHSIKVGGLYCILSPESWYYRPREFHSRLKKAMKVGKAGTSASVCMTICWRTHLSTLA